MQAPFVIVPGGFQFHWGGRTLTPPSGGHPPLKVNCHKSRHVAYQMKALDSRNQNMLIFSKSDHCGVHSETKSFKKLKTKNGMYFFVFEFRKLKICMQAPFVIVPGGFQFHWGGAL